MNKRILALVLAVLLIFAVGCESGEKDMDNNNKDNTSDGKVELQDGEVVFKAKVTSVDNESFIEAEMVDSEIAFGIYWVLVDDVTKFYDLNGSEISRSDVEIGDVIEIVFSGQVMNSYPPKISAIRIYRH